MSKRFKTKKRIRINKLFILIFILLIIFLSFNIFNSINLEYWITNDYTLLNININRNKLLLKSALNYDYVIPNIEIPVFDELNIKKKIYIYNTHQTEEYVGYDVYQASLLLKEELEQYNIDVLVEDINIKEELNKLGYDYSKSYRITRTLLESILSDDYSLYIDLHRDSSNKDITTLTIDDVSYAKIMFVVGGKHEDYLNNYNVVDELNKMIKNNLQEISRGIYTRMSSSYNQDLSENIILIELGGPENTKEEVSNSIKLLALAINDYLNE